ncbi:MAG: NAD(+) synthase [Spirochaetales bacterium]|nr:NAD(+) synthase [Spirochaetales bacterium]
MSQKFSKEILNLDCEKEAARITEKIRQVIPKELKRQGAVVAISGGIDSTVVAGLCVKALGPKKVLTLMMPEKDSSSTTKSLSQKLADHLGTDNVYEDISPILDALGCYKRRDDAIREVIPEFTSEYKSKIILPSVIDSDSFRLFSVVAQSPDGKEIKARLTPKAYLGIVAATNFKQRVRKMLEYYHADRLNYVATGTPNRLEYDQGFFVKLGDGSADIKPIAHLYKSQVYQMARYLGMPDEICNRLPTTDTYSLPQSQEEFYFSLPYDKMDLCLYGKNNDVPIEEVAEAVGITVEQVQRVYTDIEQKRRTTRYMHLPPILMEKVKEIIL